MDTILISTLLLGLFIYGILSYRRILLYMRDVVNEPRYTRAVDLLLASIESMRPEDTLESLTQTIAMITGTIPYSTVRYLSEETLCTICQENIERHSPALYLPCGHVGHDECMRNWLRENNRCPNCNTHA